MPRRRMGMSESVYKLTHPFPFLSRHRSRIAVNDSNRQADERGAGYTGLKKDSRVKKWK